jgi:hypothetical protein
MFLLGADEPGWRCGQRPACGLLLRVCSVHERQHRPSYSCCFQRAHIAAEARNLVARPGARDSAGFSFFWSVATGSR